VSATTRDVDTCFDLLRRRRELLRHRDAVDTELVAIEHALRDKGAPGMAGRPRKEYTMTRDEAKEAHRRFNAGDRSAAVVQGEREYARRTKREARLRAQARKGPTGQ